MEILYTEETTEKSIFRQLNIYQKDFRPFARTLIVEAFHRGNTDSLANFLSRPEHVECLNQLKASEIQHINLITENRPKQPLITNFSAYESIKDPISVAMVLHGYELKCLGCGTYHLNEKAIGFNLPQAEIDQAQERGADLDEIEALIPNTHCPSCEGINSIEYLVQLEF